MSDTHVRNNYMFARALVRECVLKYLRVCVHACVRVRVCICASSYILFNCYVLAHVFCGHRNSTPKSGHRNYKNLVMTTAFSTKN